MSQETDAEPTAGTDDTDERGPTAGPEGTTTYPREALAEDARTLVSEIEAVHPDPYRGYGGRVPLHRRLEETVQDLPERATAEAFYRRASALVAGMGDVHSKLHGPDDDRVGEDERLPVDLRVLGDGLYVEAVHDEAYVDLLGRRVLAVEGEPVGALADRAAALRGAENRLTERLALVRMVTDYAPLDRLLDREEPPATPTVTVEGDDGERRRSLVPVPADADPVDALDRTVERPDGSGPRFQLYEDGDAAVFVPGDLLGYREAVEAARARGADYAEQFARDAHEEHVDGDPPEDLDALVAELPSMTETIVDLVRTMDGADTEALIVDLRDNPGGDSRFLHYLVYALFGWDGVVEGAHAGIAVKRRTGPHREHYGVPEHAADEYATTEANPADYDFGPLFRHGDVDRGTRVERLKDRLTADTFRAEVEEGTHEAYYCPDEVVAVTTARTMSSGFAGAAQLATTGADLVGVPSGQAPVSFGEAVEVTLPNTGLTADVAGSIYHWVPDPDGEVLPVDRELTPERFERLDRAGDAGLRLAFEHAGVVDRGDRPAPA
jgi:hypothetical protein